MNIFLSSVIAGFTEYREAAAHGIRVLGHDVVRAEDFGASEDPAQVVCLAGVRGADAVVLILGARYGVPQASGFSATYEEYVEARERCPVLVFIQEGVARESLQEEFIRQVQAWTSGHFTASFRSADELRDGVTRGLHHLLVSRSGGKVDEVELLDRARRSIPPERQVSGIALSLIVAGGPLQQVLRPVELESRTLIDVVKQKSLFGEVAVLSPDYGTTEQLKSGVLALTQDHAAARLDEVGTVSVIRELRRPGREYPGGLTGSVVIEEDVCQDISRALRFVDAILSQIDPVRRLSDVVPIVSLHSVQHTAWRTRAEHLANPNTISPSMTVPQRVDAVLSPARRQRAALSLEADRFAEDLMVLLRRAWRP